MKSKKTVSKSSRKTANHRRLLQVLHKKITRNYGNYRMDHCMQNARRQLSWLIKYNSVLEKKR